jgi:hypothetical protein
MHAIDRATAVGTEVPGTPALHVQRSAVRRLIASLFDAWDDGDGAGFAAHFAPQGRWRDLAGVTTPHTGLSTRFVQWRAWEPWSLHWLSNEQIVSDDHHVEGRWLWSSASTVSHGTQPAWSGGDLVLEAVRQKGGWLIKDLVMTHRYCTPYAEGWLTTPMMQLDVPGAAPVVEAGEPPGTPEACSSGPATATDGRGIDLDGLGAERDLRSLMWSFIDDQEEGRDPEAIARHFSVDGSLERVGPGLLRSADVGRDAIAGSFQEERRRESAVTRILCSESIAVEGPRASCRWRDLWTATRKGEARWVSHRYAIDAVVEDGTWRISRMVRDRVLDCSHNDGWYQGGGVAR